MKATLLALGLTSVGLALAACAGSVSRASDAGEPEIDAPTSDGHGDGGRDGSSKSGSGGGSGLDASPGDAPPVCVIKLSQFGTSCTNDSDCAFIAIGNCCASMCNCNPNTPNAAISKTSYEGYQIALNAAELAAKDAPDNSCGINAPGDAGGPVCHSGQCSMP